MKRVFVASLGLAVPILTLAAPAIAAPRDDVLAGISRCAAIADDRTWLDCLYGAAQPLRARLGLPPAPESQTRLSMPGPGMLARPAAQAYAPAQPLYATPEQQFGTDDISRRQASAVPHIASQDTPSRITARMISYNFAPSGQFTVTLSNGQVWQQNHSNGPMAHWKRPAASYVINIFRGLLGDYNLITDDGNGAYKVDRVR